FTRLNGWPMHSPTDASPPSLRTATHGLGPIGSLLLHRIGLAPTAHCRSPGALRKILDTTGLAESAAEFFLEAAWQRCVVHWYRNIFSHVPSTKVREIAAMLKAIHASEDLAAAREKANRVIEKLRGLRLSRAAELVETAVEETLTYYAFPEEHWRRIRTNNPLERILREIRRRTRVVGAFPDGQSALNLAAARLRHIAGTAWST